MSCLNEFCRGRRGCSTDFAVSRRRGWFECYTPNHLDWRPWQRIIGVAPCFPSTTDLGRGAVEATWLAVHFLIFQPESGHMERSYFSIHCCTTASGAANSGLATSDEQHTFASLVTSLMPEGNSRVRNFYTL